MQRYEHTSASSEKVDGHIDFPLTVNMLPYTVKKDNQPVDMSKYIYELSTVIVHQGTMDTGHYFAYTRLGGDKVRHSFHCLVLCMIWSVCAWANIFDSSGY